MHNWVKEKTLQPTTFQGHKYNGTNFEPHL